MGDDVPMDDLTADLGKQWYETVRQNMKRLMKAQKLSYAALAELTGLPRSTLSNVANGEDRMTIRVLVPVAAALGVSTDELLGLGNRLASLVRSKPSKAGGRVDLQGLKDHFIIPVGVDIPELGLFAGDLLEMEKGGAMAEDQIVAVLEHDGDSRLYRVRSLDPTILVRGGGPAVVFDPAYLTLQAVATTLHRKLQR